jgi:hypothetical protein
MLDEQLKALATERARWVGAAPVCSPLSNGGTLISIPDLEIGPGWDRERVTVLFVAPPGYPAAQPDCFWVEPGGFRLSNGGTPQATNDSNPIPGDAPGGRNTTWFSWHLQSWNPNKDTLMTFYNAILQRLIPAR